MAVLLSRGGGSVNHGRPDHIAAGASHAMPHAMPDERLHSALGRLEQALTRAEGAVVALDRAIAGEIAARDSIQTELGSLRERHLRLRASAAAAVEQLDGLIAPAPTEVSHDG
ncbi:MAG: hypothetical protein JWM75_2133 [Sphingomonas bacterium]|nr:hypothetical protein [Sphingomonas bacterium]